MLSQSSQCRNKSNGRRGGGAGEEGDTVKETSEEVRKSRILPNPVSGGIFCREVNNLEDFVYQTFQKA